MQFSCCWDEILNSRACHVVAVQLAGHDTIVGQGQCMWPTSATFVALPRRPAVLFAWSPSVGSSNEMGVREERFAFLVDKYWAFKTTFQYHVLAWCAESFQSSSL